MRIFGNKVRTHLAIIVSASLSLLLLGSLPAAAVVDTATASISGTVQLAPDLGTSSAYVHVVQADKPYWGAAVVAVKSINADGAYSVTGLPAGRYKVAFSEFSSSAEGQWYSNASAYETATVVNLAAGQSVTGINATVVKRATISGKVTTPPGVNLSSISVEAFRTQLPVQDPSPNVTAVGADGTYRITGVTAGTYKLRFRGWNSGVLEYWYENAQTEETATLVTVSQGQDLTGINATLSKAATINGKVTVPTGVQPYNVSVEAYAADDPTGFEMRAWKANAYVGADGTYTLTGLTAGSYKVYFRSHEANILSRFNGNAASFSGAAPVTLATGQDVPEINADLVNASNISGRITVPPGANPSFLRVIAISADGTASDSSANVNFDGSYTIVGMVAGSYKLRVLGTLGSPADGVEQWYSNASSFDVADALTVADGQDLLEINMSIASKPLTASVPAITGSAKVGSTLTVLPGIWGPSPVALRYQWKANGAVIAGATAATYKPAAADLGKTLTVTVTGSRSWYTESVKNSAATAPVAAGTLTAPVPTITGTRKAGYTLTAVPGTWGPSPVTLRYQWYRSGVAIVGAAAKTYTLSGADSGKLISVRVTGSQPGYATATKASAATASITPGTLAAPTPTIAGTKRVGYVLTANPGTWTSGTTLRYQWYRSGVAIAGATGRTYRLVTADRYDTIKVRTVGSKTGYTTTTRFSASTVRIP